MEGVRARDSLFSTITTLANTLSEPPNFVGVQHVPDVFIFRMTTESMVFKCPARFRIKDREGPCVGKRAWEFGGPHWRVGERAQRVQD